MKKVLLVVSEKGYTWDEVIYPYLEFQKKGWQVAFATPVGGTPKVDPVSIIVRPVLQMFGYGTA
ncbi:MAG TPA: type 1 glutamine amidotransferase domain-containing protein, partial [Candidatus Paceibacterota bacterium]|nr:type 1 glutamine amidotransferase domain-containing protein [Candidatus Paceibacterota bacterium]